MRPAEGAWEATVLSSCSQPWYPWGWTKNKANKYSSFWKRTKDRVSVWDGPSPYGTTRTWFLCFHPMSPFVFPPIEGYWTLSPDSHVHRVCRKGVPCGPSYVLTIQNPATDSFFRPQPASPFSPHPTSFQVFGLGRLLMGGTHRHKEVIFMVFLLGSCTIFRNSFWSFKIPAANSG